MAYGLCGFKKVWMYCTSKLRFYVSGFGVVVVGICFVLFVFCVGLGDVGSWVCGLRVWLLGVGVSFFVVV